MSKATVQVKGCGTCGRVIEAPDDIMANSYPPLSGVAHHLLSNPKLLVGPYNKPIRLNFLHLWADVECPECGDKARIEVRL